jgi:hypothetical protein
VSPSSRPPSILCVAASGRSPDSIRLIKTTLVRDIPDKKEADDNEPGGTSVQDGQVAKAGAEAAK